MTEISGPPSGNPANQSSLAGLLRTWQDKLLQTMDDCLPARVLAVTIENGKRFVTVQPLIMMGTTAGEKVSRAQVARIPVYQLSGGGFVISMPIREGDFGWIKANDRDTSLFLQSLAEEWPNTVRKHSFQDGVFFPDRMRDWTLAEDDASRLVLQSDDGLTRVAIGATTVDIEAPGAVTVVAETADVTASGAITVTGGSVTVNGPVTFSGAVQFDSTVTIGGIEFMSHTHGGVTTGAGTSGGVTP